jgi:parallel beta-helix repeat protein
VSDVPIAFLSYVRFDDEYENGRLTELCSRLSGEIRLQTGSEFTIFQDRKDISWGQQWQERIDESLDGVTFLIPIVTPSFFKREACRSELERFLDREKQLKRNDLILPVYYVDCPVLTEAAKRDADPLAKVIASRQRIDWRELRFEPLTSPELRKMIAKMAKQFVDALDRAPTQRSAAPAPQENGSRKSSDVAESTIVQEKSASAHSSEAAPRVSQKTEPPTHVVDAFHRGDYATLTDAIKAAKAGDRILVRPGLYKEGIVLDKPIEIIGEGVPNDIVIEAKGKNVVLFQANMGRIANLTFRQTGGEGNWYGIHIAQGRLNLEGCDISCQSSACVAIRAGADPRLLRNRIHDGKQSGVFVTENGLGTLEDNEIFGNAFAGVEIRSGGNPTLRRNRIHDGKSVGVFVYENGQGTLEDNEIFGNALSGVAIKRGGNPALRRNRISKNGYEAIWVHDGGCGLFEDNDLRGNPKGAWDIAPDCVDKVKRARNQE